MHLKREFKWKVFAFQIFKFLRGYTLLVVCSFFLLAALANTASAEPTNEQQQTVKISGKVTDPSGEALIGASVVEKGTTNGTVTDMDGAYTLNVSSSNATVEVKYIGFLTSSVKVASGKNVYDVQLKEDSQSLDEVIVVGYGVQKKKLVTGATLHVSGDDMQKLSTINPFTALQSKVPGVSIIQSSGQPGSGYIINIRGLGTTGDSRPLYVVDGVASGNNALNNMSASDIESIDILKDAASCAIYGARAANGVVLITTKQGKAGKMQITYDGFYGQQYLAKKPDLLNATQYMAVQDEMRFNNGQPPVNWQAVLPAKEYKDIMSGKWNGTDWVDAFYCKGAPTENHSFNLTGGNDVSKFSLGYSYNLQKGIFGEAVQSDYNRHTFRANSDHVLLKAKDFDAIKIGENLNFVYSTTSGIPMNNDIYWNGMRDIMVANPLYPVYNSKGGYYDYTDEVKNGWNYDGQFANPIGRTATSGRGLNLSKNYGLNASAYLQIQPIKGLILKSLYGYQMSAGDYRSQDQKGYWSAAGGDHTVTESIYQSANMGYQWSLDNTLTYNLNSGGHHAEIQVGQSVEKRGYGENISASGQNNIFDLGWDYAWVDNTKPTSLGQIGAGGSPYGMGALASFWGRVNYNYKETYMASLILRSDASSNFDKGHRWGYFPSASVGWVLTNESFMEGAKGAIDFLKLRASWGQNGNENIDAFQYLTLYSYSTNYAYYFGTNPGKADGTRDVPSTGAAPGVLQNPNVTWETQEQINLGFDSRFLNNRLGLTFDYYTRTTKNWLLPAPIIGTFGRGAPFINGGDVRNRGVELDLSWEDHINDFTYSVDLNGSYNQNKVTRIASEGGIIHGQSGVISDAFDEIYRAQVGYPMGYFYGYKTNGIFQTVADVNNYKNAQGGLIQPNAKPGDIRFVDVDGDGQITTDDRTMIGCGWPKIQSGFTFTLGYKGFDFIATAAGAFGFQIFKSYRNVADVPNDNFTTDVFRSWTGAGTSNKWPILTRGSNVNYINVSDLYLENGDYVKIQNLTLGYDFKRLFPRMPLAKARLYFTAQNVFTITGYSGMDPELGNGDDTSTINSWVTGIDQGYYPAPKTYMVGVNLTF